MSLQSRAQKNVEEQVAMNIQSMEKFYHLSSEKKLISIIIDKKQSEKLFKEKQVMISSIFNNNQNSQEQKQQEKITLFAQKYSYENLVQKFPRPKAGTNQLLINILQKKLQKQVIKSHQTRKNIWLLASGAKFAMINNRTLYKDLLNYQDYPHYFDKAINQDLHRTVNKTTSTSSQQDLVALKNVLVAFSRRNPFIGYCQGLNFIAFFILTMQFTEEQSFFLLSMMLETIVPMDYYTNMIGVVCDQQIFINILKVMKPHIVQKFNQVGLDPSVLSIQWFVCLFTSSLPFYLAKIVWDRLLVEGTKAFIKTGLILLGYFQKQIMQTTQFHQIIMLLQKGTKKLQVSEADFNQQFQKIYINRKGLKIARDLYREYHIKQKLSQKVISKKRKTVQQKCDLRWPICIANLQKCKRQRQQIDVWIYRQQKPPKLIHDYLSNKSKNFNQKLKINSSFAVVPDSGQKKNKKVLICNQKAPDGDLAGKKDLGFKNQNCQQNLIIGRMEHICSKKKQLVIAQRKNMKKNDVKFLSMILQQSTESSLQDKKAETFKKIQQLSSQIYIPNYSKEEQIAQNENVDISRSRTINFYNKFIQQNRELSFIIGNVNQNQFKQNKNNEQSEETQIAQERGFKKQKLPPQKQQ